ncbi:unnamed protein product, partial [Ixodes pacificus]
PFWASATHTLLSCPTQASRLPSPEKLTECTQPAGHSSAMRLPKVPGFSPQGLCSGGLSTSRMYAEKIL